MILRYLTGKSCKPLFIGGDSTDVLKDFPDTCVDMVMTSPPYWCQREYENRDGIGLESCYAEYIDRLMAVFNEVYRILKPSGSFWLNIGDTYANKTLMGIPWRIAIKLCDEQGWILRNDVIWNKVKGAPDNSGDKLRNVYENLFHFVKTRKYYYDVSMIRKNPQKAKIQNGAVVSATGVTGVRYKRQIELSTALTEDQKSNALAALEDVLNQMKEGKLGDFRMIIRGQQRTTHSDSSRVSGRAKELETKGFYFLKYHPDGAKLGDVWDIIPEDSQKRKTHFAPYPSDLCRTPVLTTCPPDGLVLDPFCGTGTTMEVAYENNRKSIGIDIAQSYLSLAKERFDRPVDGRRSSEPASATSELANAGTQRPRKTDERKMLNEPRQGTLWKLLEAK
ncbi:MAG: site-specific DNA-methyltransferase [Coriobacteriales bacterium]|jgi:DNA modification methylase|nr:site-specific DNA-methyltransferase [Coriobacteriales bacterium]